MTLADAYRHLLGSLVIGSADERTEILSYLRDLIQHLTPNEQIKLGVACMEGMPFEEVLFKTISSILESMTKILDEVKAPAGKSVEARIRALACDRDAAIVG